MANWMEGGHLTPLRDSAIRTSKPLRKLCITATMVFVLGVNFAETRLVKKALESFYGLGPLLSERIMAKYSIHKLATMGSLAPRTVTSLTAELGQMPIESDARKTLQDNIKRLKDMGAYRGRRHAMGLPVRGQRTRNQNATPNKLNRVNRKG
ncbi:mitochondrial 37S ribosomal protein SWS2 [Beauveria bassiana ARSEF 2860]|uniref:Mitochondrial 37S ribosomal protein SWS2 n=3 Tax=Beauveria bassiana TaxID=176275 RepID=J4KMF7_BEAB2|nr:mitochondrial 37S ribosomal protein SWS2 [Beauveria bassiana ARSEF 2860]EJP63874.1 mitochondrial 37S ribosomal protein SWS2 [Beauveria bassiana ARSEF 2860]